LKEKRIW